MTLVVSKIVYRPDKNCFITIPKELSNQIRGYDQVQVFKVDYGCDQQAYFSSDGQTPTRNNSILINAIYAERLQLSDENEVVIKEMPSPLEARKVHIEPQSVDDWEMFEKYSEFVESNLMNQIRVVWKGQIFPLWADKITLYLKISSVEPVDKCVLLCNDTEVIISPKVRNSSQGVNNNHARQSLGTTDRKERSVSPIKKQKSTPVQARPTSIGVPPRGTLHNDVKVKKHSGWNPLRIVSGFLGGGRAPQSDRSQFYLPGASPDSDSLDSVDGSPSPDRGFTHTSQSIAGINFKFRVQSLKVNLNFDDCELDGCEEEISSKLSLQQPNTVFVNSEDIQEHVGNTYLNFPDVFYAKLTRLSSPKEVYARAEEAANQKREKADKLESSSDSTSLKNSRGEKKEKQLNCIVRVVVLTKKGLHSKPHFIQMIEHVLDEQACLRGHVIVPDLLRRLMNLDVTRSIWLQSIDPTPYQALAFDLQAVTALPKSFGNYHVQEAFKKWVREICSVEVPFVMFPGVMIKVQLVKDISLELQVLYHDQKYNEREAPTFSCMDRDNVDELSFYIKNPVSLENSKWPILPMLAYMDIKDPCVPRSQFTEMGGIEELSKEASDSVEICLASKPLGDSMFRKITPGLRNGMILITGPKGSGKTMFAQALCRKHAELPNLAYILNIDCKPLRGKRPDTIQKMLQMAFDEAAWRQPSVILLDDLEQVMPAPSGPEAEMSGEAIYGARVAEILRDLLRKEVCDGTRIAVVATSVTRNAIHPLLVNSRGTHFVQTMLVINPPDKARRRKILESIIKCRPVINPKTLDEVDLEWLQCKTEGYVASDLMNLVSRALHANWLKHGHSSDQNGVTLHTEEFKEAIEGFTPASIRNVPLHTAGELGWDDVGGLDDVKSVLIETLQWPSKYPKLFSKCPLRLRSGLLLYGAPGTGKTLLAGVVAKECGLNFISIKGPELLNKYIGASEQAVRDTFIRAQSAKPCILFFDEFDSIAPRRGHDNTGVTDRVVNQLLTQLDGVEGLEGVYVLAATSRPDLIDPALLRPGRLDKCLRCNLPSSEDRKSILKALTRKVQVCFDVNLDKFAESCENFTGADFKALLYNAQLEAIHTVTGATKTDKFDYSAQKSPSYFRTRRRSSSYGILAKAAEMERDTKKFKSDIMYVQNLKEGLQEMTEDLEDQLNQQVQQIRTRLKVCQKTENVTTAESLFSPAVAAAKNPAILIREEDIIKALAKTRPSVPAEERFKYQNIYENFVSSRGGNFAQNIMEGIGQRQTCA